MDLFNILSVHTGKDGYVNSKAMEALSEYFHAGGDFSILNDQGQNLLFIVNCSRIAKTLIRQGVNVNGFDIHGKCPLDYCKDPETKAVLVESGARKALVTYARIESAVAA